MCRLLYNYYRKGKEKMREYITYQNKVCVVTGAASGIGKALCEMLIDCGAEVYAIDRNGCELNGVKCFIKTDLSEKNSIDEAFNRIPEYIDCFFGVAGLSGAKTGYYTTFTVNFIANKYITDVYLSKRMGSGSSITYVSSCGGLMWERWQREYRKVMYCNSWEDMIRFMKKVSPKDGPGALAYALSKRALNYYTSLKAAEYGSRGIRVNALLPGSTDTGMKKEFETMAGGSNALISENGAAGRLATPEEMAEPLLFLGSDMAGFVSGLMLVADSGNNSAKTVGLARNKMNIPVALKLYNLPCIQKLIAKKTQQ